MGHSLSFQPFGGMLPFVVCFLGVKVGCISVVFTNVMGK